MYNGLIMTGVVVVTLLAAPTETRTTLYHFTGPQHSWWAVNDTVMGGVSRSQWRQPEGAAGVFEGELSLENNGGFTSVRSSEIDVLPDETRSLVLRVRGDGRTYRFMLRSSRVGRGVSYQQAFTTRAGQWIDVRLPLTEFSARWRGRAVSAPPLRPADVKSLGFLLADKRAGAFRLELESVHSSVRP